MTGFPWLLVGGGLVTAAAAVVGNGNFVAAVAPIILGACAWATWVAPLRTSLFVLIFLSLGLDVAGTGPWDSPLAPIGRLLSFNLDKTIPVPIPVPGAVILLGLLLLIHMHRGLSGSRIDAVGRSETAAPLFGGLAVSALAVLALCAWGAVRGGDLQLAKMQVQNFLVLLLVAYLAAVSFRNVVDYRSLGRIIVAAGCLKALIALYVIQTIVPTPDYATSHGDSVLFACATIILVVRYAEQPTRRHLAWSLVLLPLLFGGMVANGRRLVWVQLAACLLIFWMVSRRTQAKRYFAYALLAATPVFAAYVAIGLNSDSSVFAPISAFKSVGGSEAETDSSTLYRDTENYNLLLTMRANSFVGSGFGHPFTEFVKLPDISFFKEYQYMPHNSVLGLWAFTGALGFTAISLAFVAGVYLAARSYQFARTAEQRVAAFMVIATVLVHAVQCWGDIGFSEHKSIYLVGPGLAVAGQLAMITGAWGVRSARPARVSGI